MEHYQRLCDAPAFGVPPGLGTTSLLSQTQVSSRANLVFPNLSKRRKNYILRFFNTIREGDEWSHCG